MTKNTGNTHIKVTTIHPSVDNNPQCDHKLFVVNLAGQLAKWLVLTMANTHV